MEVLDAVGGRASGRCRCPAPASRSRRGRPATHGRRTGAGTRMRSSAAPCAVASDPALRACSAQGRPRRRSCASTRCPRSVATERVDEIRVDVERLVGRNRPRRGRPDHRHRGPSGQARRGRTRAASFVAVRVVERKRRRRRRCPCGPSYSTSASASARAAIEAPVDRLQAAIDEALLQQPAERADLVGLVAGTPSSCTAWSQSPSTPRRWKSAFCRTICSVA